MTELGINQIHCIDVGRGLKRLPDNSVDCVMTSPPYWALRDYGNAPVRWADGKKCVLGLEESLHDYIRHLCDIFDEVRRVLKRTGTCWVNLGDTYHNASKWTCKKEVPQTICRGNSRDFKTGRRLNQGFPEKCLAQIPGQFALEMTRRGWILRNDIVWHKPNHMPSSVKDRFSCSWEHLFFFVKAKRYYFDLDAVRVPHKFVPKHSSLAKTTPTIRSTPSLLGVRRPPRGGEPGSMHPAGKNPGDSWDIQTRPFRGAHFAVFPEQLCERPIKSGCPEKVCKRCGSPAPNTSRGHARRNPGQRFVATARFGCHCKKGFVAGLVLDPFAGSGTTTVVAKRLGRRFIGFDANPAYVQLAKQRLTRV